MEVERKVIKLQLDDGTVVDLPLTLLPFFRTLHAMVVDIGAGLEGIAIPVANITEVNMRWLILFYEDYLVWVNGRVLPNPLQPSLLTMRYFMVGGIPRKFTSLGKVRLVSLLALYNFLHFNDSRPAELFVQMVLFDRLMDEEESLGVINLIAIEDVPFWAPHKPVVEYILRCLPYARRYREVLSFLRESAPNVTPVLLEQLPRPTLSPIVCGSNHTFVLTPEGLFACGTTVDGVLGLGRPIGNYVSFLKLQFKGMLISFATGLDQTMLLTTAGLFACGFNGYGQLGLGNGWMEDVPKMVGDVEDFPLSVACGVGKSMLITSEGLFACGFNEDGDLGLGNRERVQKFSKVPFIVGRPLSVVCGTLEIMLVTTEGLFSCAGLTWEEKQNVEGVRIPQFDKVVLPGAILSVACGTGHTMVVTSTGLFARGQNHHGQLGLGDKKDREHFHRVEIRGEALSVSCGDYHTILLTTEGLFVCGTNLFGQLGIGMAYDRTSFEVVKLGVSPFFTACGSNHTLLLAKEGLLACGDAKFRQLGFNMSTRDVQYVSKFTSSTVPGLPLTPVVEEEEEGPERKKQRLACRICDTSAPKMRQEVENLHRLFCSELCQKKYHYFDQIMRVAGLHK